MLTDLALERFRQFVRREIVAARYRVGTAWSSAVINAVEVQSDGTVRARLSIIPDADVTVNRVELLTTSGQTWAEQDVSIAIKSPQTGILFWFDFKIEEVDSHV